MPENLDMPDSVLYIGLRFLYGEYHAGRLDKTQAGKEKNQLIKNWGNAKRMEELNLKVAHRRTLSQEKAVEYVKNPTLENANAYFAATLGIPENWKELEPETFIKQLEK